MAKGTQPQISVSALKSVPGVLTAIQTLRPFSCKHSIDDDPNRRVRVQSNLAWPNVVESLFLTEADTLQVGSEYQNTLIRQRF